MSEDQRPPDEAEPTNLDSGDLPSGPADSSTGKRLGDFELLRELGRGGGLR